jgi:hypothetical protein
MARFFSVLSGSVPTTLTSSVSEARFNSRSISDGINKRNGLIASRSAVSTDIYNELDAVNKDGSRGTYFPPDLLQTVGSPLLLTGSVYTSSVAGIRTPTTNTYGGSGVVNYSLRPTASIISTQTTLVTASSPPDSADVNNNTYLSASKAVKDVLDSITNGGPYGRLGNNSSRTLHSIWHDPDLGYFAWDDFTPGQPVASNDSVFLLAISPSQSNAVSCSVRIEYEKTFENDFNSAAKMDFRIDYTSTNGGGARFSDFLQVIVTGSELPSGNKNRFLFTTAVLDCVSGIASYDMKVTMSYFDPIITSSEGPRTQFTSNKLLNMACGAGTQF